MERSILAVFGRAFKKQDVHTNSSCGRTGPEPTSHIKDVIHMTKLFSRDMFAALHTCDGAALMPQCQSQTDVVCEEEQDSPPWA